MSTGVKTAVGKFVWHDNSSTDPKKAQDFYTQLLGWEIEVFKPGEMDYGMIKAGGQTHGGFGTAQGGAPSHWIGHVLVEDLDETLRRIEAAGGKIVAGPMDIPDVGRMAIISDPQGAVLSAFQPASDEMPVSEGTFVWDELHTSDVAGAKSFYGEVFGWTAQDRDMGPMTYTMFKRAGDVDVGGCMALEEGMQAPPHWLPYIYADDIDATTAKAKELGATIFVEPADIPDVGRFSVLQDPVGAVFGLFRPNAT